MNDIYQTHLKTLKKIDSFARMGYKLHLYEFAHSCPHSSHFAQPKDTPLRLLVFTLTTIYNMDLRCCNKTSLSQMHIVFIYALISISLDFFRLHHSLTSTPYIIYPFFKQHDYFAKSLAQWSLTTTSLVVQNYLQEKEKETHTRITLVASFLHSAFPLSITQTFFQCNNSLHHL